MVFRHFLCVWKHKFFISLISFEFLQAEAEKLPGNAVFLKAVAKSNTYLKRTLVYNKRIDSLRFFNIHKSGLYFFFHTLIFFLFNALLIVIMGITINSLY